MTVQEVREEIRAMIEKSERRVQELKEKDICTREYKAYHDGFQQALLDALRVLDFAE